MAAVTDTNPKPAPAPKLEYVPAFDGIRGLGALAVIVAHYGYLRCGWIPVQFFFILSGFLITAILLSAKEKSTTGAYFGNYFWRRALRIFPLYFGYLALVAIGFAIFHQHAPPGTWRSLLTYTHNFYIVGGGRLSYYFSHLWSLQVEEQFYLLWPVVILLLSRRALRILLMAIIVLVPVARVALFLHAGGFAHPAPWLGLTFYMHTLFQLDAIATGALIATAGWMAKRLSPWLFIVAAVFMWAAGGINAILGGSAPPASAAYSLVERGAGMGYPLFMAGNFQFLWGYSLVNLVSALLIIVAAQPNFVARFLDNRVLCYLGRMCYGIYVFHLPVQKIFNLLFPAIDPRSLKGFVLFFPMLAVDIALAHLSFYFFEMWFLQRKDFFKKKAPAGLSGVSAG